MQEGKNSRELFNVWKACQKWQPVSKFTRNSKKCTENNFSNNSYSCQTGPKLLSPWFSVEWKNIFWFCPIHLGKTSTARPYLFTDRSENWVASKRMLRNPGRVLQGRDPGLFWDGSEGWVASKLWTDSLNHKLLMFNARSSMNHRSSCFQTTTGPRLSCRSRILIKVGTQTLQVRNLTQAPAPFLLIFSRALLLARSDSACHSVMSFSYLSVRGRTPLTPLPLPYHSIGP